MSNQINLFGKISLAIFVLILFVVLSYKLIILDIQNDSLQEMMLNLTDHTAILTAENNFTKGKTRYFEYKPSKKSIFLRSDDDGIEIWSYGFALVKADDSLKNIQEYKFLKALDDRFISHYNQKMRTLINK